jgi:two-component system LytT family response regulator
MKALIIDDEPLARGIVREYLSGYASVEVAGECGDGFEALKAITATQPDLLFLDVQMPKITGFEMLELIDGEPPAVIFTTAYDEYALRAFESNAVDYLLKPFSRERFDKAMKRFLEGGSPRRLEGLNEAVKHPDEGARVVVKRGTSIRILPTADVHYIEAFDDYVKLFTKEGFELKKKSMNYFEKVLNPSEFVRTHRSYIINLKELSRIEPMQGETHLAVLRSGVSIPVSKSGYLKLREVLKL